MNQGDVFGERGIINYAGMDGVCAGQSSKIFFLEIRERLLVDEKIPRNDILSNKYARIGILWKMDLENFPGILEIDLIYDGKVDKQSLVVLGLVLQQ